MNEAKPGVVAVAEERRERRGSVLSDTDIERIETAFDRRLAALFEAIGYDTSSPQERNEIRKDHEFVRDTRRAKGKVLTAFVTGIGGSIALWIWNAFGGKGH